MILMYFAILQALIKARCERQVFDMKTEAEIMKALGICSSEHLGCEDGCPYEEDSCISKDGENIFFKDIIALINRQKAEIERLSNFVTEERCREIANEMIPPIVKQVKAEAIKEFAERLKNTSEDTTDYGHPYVLCKDIDNLVKELTSQL